MHSEVEREAAAGRHMSLSTRCYPDNVIEIYDWQKYYTQSKPKQQQL